MKINNYWKKIFLALILLLGSAIRLVGPIRGDFAFTYDTGRDFLAIRKIVLEHKLTLLGPTTGLPGVFYGPWWYYFLTVPFFIFQGNPQYVAIIIALSGIAVILLMFLWAKYFWQTQKGSLLLIVLIGIVAFSSSHIGNATQIWNPSLLPLAIAFWLFSFLFFLDQKNWASLLMGLFSALVLEMQAAFGIFFFISQLLALEVVYRRQWSFKKLVFFFTGALIIFSPRIIFELRHNFLMSKSIIKFFSEEGFSAELGLINRLFQRLIAFWEIWNNTLANGATWLGISLVIFCLIARFFYYRRFLSKERKMVNFLIIVFLGIYFMFSFYGGSFWSYYLVGLPLLFAVLLAILWRAWSFFLKPRIFLVISILYLLFLFWQDLSDFIKNIGWEGDIAVYRNVINVVHETYRQANGRPFNFIVYTPPVIPYTYQYLFTWLAEEKYHNLPQQENQSLLFAIIEPDKERPSRQEQWMLEYKDDGKIINERLLPGEVILQVRKRE
jgi:hypothetical protein